MSIEQQYVDRHPGSARLYDRAGAVLPSGVTHDSRFLRPFPVYARAASGSRKTDVDGNEYVDYVMGHGALLLGHGYPTVQEAAARQMALGTHYGASHELEIEWAEEVVRLVPSAEVVRFTSSGTEATLMALRLARSFTGRPALLKFERHFHGWHDYVAASSKYAGAAPAGVPEATMETVVICPPTLEAARAAMDSRPDIGAVIVEAAGASSGTLPIPGGFLHGLRKLTEERGALLIMDEVVTGFRWAPGGVQELEGVRPDLTTLAKILAGGFPGGAVAGRRDVMERLAFPAPGATAEKVGHPGTFNANPLSSAAGVACLRTIADGSHQDRARDLAAKLRTGMNGELCRLGIPGFVYGQASEFRVVLGGQALPEHGDYHPRDLPLPLLEAGTPRRASQLVQLALLNRGVHFFGDGGMTSSVHTDGDIADTVAAWGESLAEARDEGAL
ncbi:MAG: aminotransferase class III-fold pyridoxal phosphate-dependent enzyme [Chloroflexi bacterium]|nr:aminotransferase class III-fold pyridoxal phosphate-dependent enzyme [Chloroflexota bacterium]